jgi:iron complex transport system substrate-binding protein
VPQPQNRYRTVVDEVGRRVEVPVRVRRVVSLAPNVTDILYALGAGDKIAGVTDFAETPAGATRKPSVGEPMEPSLERIVALRPDLVFVARSINRRETVESLDRLGIPVYATDARTVEGMLGTIRQIGALVGKQQEGEMLAASLEARLNALRARLAGRAVKCVFFVVWQDPLITTGRNTFIADALRWAGARQVLRLRQDWPHVSLEELVARQPEYLIFPEAQNETAGEIARSLKTLAGWRDLKAVQKGNVVVLGDAINRPSPELVDAIEELALRLHPGAVAQQAKPKDPPAPWHGGAAWPH